MFGYHTVKLLKLWTKFRKIFIKNNLYCRFFKFCIANKITSTHLYRMYTFNINLHHYVFNSKLQHLKNLFIQRTLRIELNDTQKNELFPQAIAPPYASYHPSTAHKNLRQLFQNAKPRTQFEYQSFPPHKITALTLIHPDWTQFSHRNINRNNN